MLLYFNMLGAAKGFATINQIYGRRPVLELDIYDCKTQVAFKK